jgi:hypothetical protein
LGGFQSSPEVARVGLFDEGSRAVSNPGEDTEFDVIEEGNESPYGDDPDEAQDDGQDPDA